jgi:hypothetical protein
MNRINTASLTIGTIAALFSLATACSSGGSDPVSSGGNTNKAGSTGTTLGGTGNSGGTGNTPTGGTPTTTGGTPTTTGGTPTTGGTGSGGTPATGGPSVCDAANKSTHILGATEGYVDNFEDDTRFTGWYSYAAVPAGMTAAAFEVVAGGERGMAGHLANTGINTGTAKFGSGVGFNMRDALDACADVSAFDGVSFWAKGVSGTSGTVSFLAVVAAQQAVADGGDCTAAMQTAGNCFKHPQADFKLTADWKQYTIKWADLAPQSLIAGRIILALQWISVGPAFDFSIDEISLYKGDAPTGPVEPATGAGGAAP